MRGVQAFLTSCTTVLLLVGSSVCAQRSSPFAFAHAGDTLRGLVETPDDGPAEALVVLVPGYGRTDFVAGNWFDQLRRELVGAGLAVLCYDKPGCGASGGEFDPNQSVDASAAEVVAAVAEARRRGVRGAERVGLWGISRAGWICPLVIERIPVAFWISVSGTDDKENFGYLLRSNLALHGVAGDEVARLHGAWRDAHAAFCTSSRYRDYRRAVAPLQRDSLSRSLFGYTRPSRWPWAGRAEFRASRASYTETGRFDPDSGLWVYVDDFADRLRAVDCPVLALFGENDSQVDWRATRSLYAETIGTHPAASLRQETFADCNHSLQACTTCTWGEDLSATGWQACPGYYEVMREWLRGIGVGE